ncbi:MAG: ABC transporter permease [Dehalococcoidia bacterium]|nr:ABC transporter permease [Dehalococcoidia bacterium]MDW8119513.1 ABC transporter permease [Chloroflexota bacterium]
MQAYILRRLLLFIPSLVGVTVVVFALVRLLPGDIATILVYQAGGQFDRPAEEMVQQVRRELGLDRPLVVQYGLWVWDLLRGDFGYSYWEKRPVWDIIVERFPRSMELTVLTIALAMVWAIPLGVIAAAKRDTWIDHVARLVTISGLSLPIFFIGVLILYVLVRVFRWMPPLEFVPLWERPAENLMHLIWPALAQAYYISAPVTRLTRSQMLEVIREDFIRTARAKGLREVVILYRHALRNALLPVVTFLGWWVGRAMGGIVVVETIFAVPGMGMGLIEAVAHRDYPAVQAYMLVLTVVFLVVNLLVDLLYAWLDPRIRYT